MEGPLTVAAVGQKFGAAARSLQAHAVHRSGIARVDGFHQAFELLPVVPDNHVASLEQRFGRLGYGRADHYIA